MLKPVSPPSLSKTFQSDFLGHLLGSWFGRVKAIGHFRGPKTMTADSEDSTH